MQELKKQLPKAPDMGSYNPLPAYPLFSSPDNPKNTLRSVWGTEERFDASGDPKKPRVKSIGPGQYQLLHEWRGKNDKRPKQRDCLEAASKPVSKSVYY